MRPRGESLVLGWLLKGVESPSLLSEDARIILVDSDEVLEVRDAILCERHDAMLADPIDPQLAIFCVHVACDVEEPLELRRRLT
jgi:hypothetical protein